MIILYELGILLVGTARRRRPARAMAGLIAERTSRSGRIGTMDDGASERPGIVYLVGAGPGDPGLLTRRGADGAGAGRRGRLRPPGEPPAARPRPGVGLADLRGQVDRPLHAVAGRDQRAARRARPRRARRSSGSRGATRTSSAAGPRRPSTSAPRGSPFEVVPGVTAGVGVTAYAGMPVTHRDAASAVAFVTGHDDPEAPEGRGRLDWAALARFPGTLVVYMGVTRLRSPLPDPGPPGQARRRPPPR